MMISEFIERTGFTPAVDYYYDVIEMEYMVSDLDKDAWCKQWKKNGGIQKAYDYMKHDVANEYANVLSLEEQLKKLNECIAQLNAENARLESLADTAMSDLNQMQEWKDKSMYELIDISEKYSSAELRQFIINEIGFKAYIAYKFEHDKCIWQLDRDEIIERMN